MMGGRIASITLSELNRRSQAIVSQYIIAAAGLLTICICADSAIANPVYLEPRPSITYTTPLSGIAWLAILNYVTNLFLFSCILLLIIRKYGKMALIISRNKKWFMRSLFFATLLITLFGANIDFYFLIDEGKLFFNVWNWILALILIFFSVFMVSFFLFNIKIRLNIMLSGFFVIFNLLSWSLIFLLDQSVAYAIIFISILLLSIPLSKISKLHDTLSDELYLQKRVVAKRILIFEFSPVIIIFSIGAALIILGLIFNVYLIYFGIAEILFGSIILRIFQHSPSLGNLLGAHLRQIPPKQF